MKTYPIKQITGLTLLALLPHLACADQLTYQENFNGTTLSDTTKKWFAINGACLTASTSNTTFSSGSPLAAGVVPGCVTSSSGTTGNSYYSGKSSTLVGGDQGANLPDANGYGVLRLTNGAASSMSSTNGNNETGAFILGNPFPSSSGMNITFTTYTWGGNAYQNNKSVKSGADGIAFFLLDASKYPNPNAPDPLTTDSVIQVTKTGAYGGSLGYDCASNKYSGIDSSGGDGIIGAYLGIGIDEFGNFVNKGDNANAYETASPGQLPNTIGIRGGGEINTKRFATSGGLPVSPNPGLGPVVQAQYVCKYGYYSTSTTSTTTVTTNTVNVGSGTSYQPPYTVISATANAAVGGNATGTSTVTWVSSADTVNKKWYITTTGTYPVQGVYDYPLLAYSNLNSTKPIFNQEYVSKPSRSVVSSVSGSGATPIKYYINLTNAGVLSVSYSYNGGVYTPIISNQSIVPSSSSLPDWFLFGFTSGTGGGSNNHEIKCFTAAQPQTGSGSAGGNIPQGEKVLAGNQIYVAYYNPLYWTGTVQANELGVDSTTGAVTIVDIANTTTPLVVWDTGCVLSGPNSCVNNPQTITTPPARAIATWNDGIAAGATTATSTPGPVAFTPANFSKLSGNEQQMLNCGTPTGTGSSCDNYGPQRIGFLIDNNVSSIASPGAGIFRKRISMLGDMINSSPLWIGNPALPYTNSWVDQLYPTATMPEGASYSTFQQSFKSLPNGARLNTVYVGANDGMVHGFAAGYGDVTTTTATDNTGAEVMAYLPSLPLSTIHNLTSPDPGVTSAGELDFTSQLYAHNDYVDAPTGYGDLYWSGAVNSSPITTKWQTWLVGGLGGGGNLGGVLGGSVDPTKGTILSATANTGVGEIYAINITNPLTPGNVSGGSDTVASNIMGDWTTNTIVCDTVSGISDTCNAHMGSTYGTPTIRRLHSGNWGIIFGNGLNSADGTAGIFIIEVTGGSSNKPTFKIHYIDAGAGPGTDPTGNGTVNGISYATPADLDGDHITDYVYAGDALGNVWRFDLTSNNPSSWGSPVKIFSASTTSSLQAVTTSVVVATIPYNGSYGVVVNFGTGRQMQQTLIGATGYTTGSQYLYGVWDWNMNSWNAKGSTQFYTRDSGITSGLSNLTAQTVVSGGNLSNATVCYGFMVNCTGTPNPSYGWYLAPVSSQEQFIYSPTIYNGIVYINSIIPPNQQTQVASCTPQPSSGNTYAINAATGNFTGQAVYNLSGVGTPFFVSTTGTSNGTTTQVTTLITQTLNGPVTQGIPPQGSTTGPATRLTWLELR